MKNNNDSRPIIVSIRCTAYNQEKYIRQCLDGFIMQQTNLRFEAIVHDDASTDGTADIIREYEKKYPDIIKPIYEEENQYSKHDGSLVRIMDEHTRGVYVAICEGDDYWTEPSKLQKQYDFMESHPECSMCFHSHNNLYPNGKLGLVEPCEKKEEYTTPDVIKFKSNVIGTNTVFYRYHFYKEEERPLFWKRSPVGDLPMKLYFASKGTIGFINANMSVYRWGAEGGWTSRKTTLKQRTKHHRAIIEMYSQYDEYTGYQYHKYIMRAKNRIWSLIVKDCLTIGRKLFKE